MHLNIEPKYRDIQFGVTHAKVTTEASGIQYICAEQPLQPYARSLADRLAYWAACMPDHLCLARRKRLPDGERGDWQHLTYANVYHKAKILGQALLNKALSADRPLIILSENGLEHALLSLACLCVGIPFCAVSPAYSLLSRDYEKLSHIVKTITPGLIYADKLEAFLPAINTVFEEHVDVIWGTLDFSSPGENVAYGAENQDWLPQNSDRSICHIADLMTTEITEQVERARENIQPASVAKFLFTSGSTKLPKAVINTHAMMCANQQQILQSLPMLQACHPVIVDWLPWSHTFGGNLVFGLSLYNGGSLYIDDGKPTPGAIHETLRNLREVAPTIYFNVPVGLEAISYAMETDAVLRKNILSRLRMFFYSGATLAQPVWDRLFAVAEQEVGERIPIGTGLGMTESSPWAIFVSSTNIRSGHLGLPTPGMTLKLVPCDEKLELRYKGVNITPGYWRNLFATHDAFDDEGFFLTGDAVRWVDPANIAAGLQFDGRIAEDFKLVTGTFVSVGPLRSKLILAGAPYVQDVVLTGLDRHEVGALVFAAPSVRHLANLPEEAAWAEVLQSAPVQNFFQKVINALSETATGSANRIACLHLLVDPPSIDRGELTDKGSLNQRAVLRHREGIVNALYDGTLAFTLKPALA